MICNRYFCGINSCQPQNREFLPELVSYLPDQEDRLRQDAPSSVFSTSNMSGNCNNNCDCNERMDQLADEFDVLRGDQDETVSSLADYATTAELDNEASHLANRIDRVEDAHADANRTLDAKLDDRIERVERSIADNFERLDNFDTEVFFNGQKITEFKEEVRQISSDSGEAVEAVVDRCFTEMSAQYDRIQHLSGRMDELPLGGIRAFCVNMGRHAKLINDLRLDHELKTCQQENQILSQQAQISTLSQDMEEVLLLLNGLPLGLFGEPFWQHVMAINRPAVTPRRGRKRNRESLFETPVRRSARLAGTPMREAQVLAPGLQ